MPSLAIFAVLAVVALLGVLGLLFAFLTRRIVPTNRVHIVQSSRKTTSYGQGLPAGNSYYEVPSFIPFFGVTVISLPVNNFQIDLNGYDAYDKDRVPFLIDVVGFFRISDTNVAAGRVKDEEGLKEQLTVIMKGAARAVLAKFDIHEVMVKRAEFGTVFTQEVDEGLKAWGVTSVKSMELMDIRDAKESTVIHSIMSQKSSEISMTSRVTVALNNQKAQEAEIGSTQVVELRKQEQAQVIGQRKAQVEQEIGIATERSKQAVQAEAKTTKDREMDTLSVQRLRTAEIDKGAAIVLADQTKQTRIIEAQAQQAVVMTEAEGSKQQAILLATGNRDAALLAAEGVRAAGLAKGDADKAIALAPVAASIALAEKITGSKEYQDYLVRIRDVEAQERIGVANASALAQADLKIIATGGDAASGVSNLGTFLSSSGGAKIGALLEGFAATDQGKALLARFGVGVAKDEVTA